MERPGTRRPIMTADADDSCKRWHINHNRKVVGVSVSGSAPRLSESEGFSNASCESPSLALYSDMRKTSSMYLHTFVATPFRSSVIISYRFITPLPLHSNQRHRLLDGPRRQPSMCQLFSSDHLSNHKSWPSYINEVPLLVPVGGRMMPKGRICGAYMGVEIDLDQ